MLLFLPLSCLEFAINPLLSFDEFDIVAELLLAFVEFVLGVLANVLVAVVVAVVVTVVVALAVVVALVVFVVLDLPVISLTDGALCCLVFDNNSLVLSLSCNFFTNDSNHF